jgi:hypothetical protein
MARDVRRLLVRAPQQIDLLQTVLNSFLVQGETRGTNVGAVRGTVNDGLTHESLLNVEGKTYEAKAEP